MKFYVLRRCLETIPVIFSVMVIIFVLIHVAPGDPAEILAGEFATPEYIQRLREQLGLDKPIWVQFFMYIQRILKGDMGNSLYYGESVRTLIFKRVGATVILTGISLLICSIFGTLLGILSGIRPHSLFDYVGVIIPLIGYSIPAFWIGQILLIVFGLYLNWFPIGGIVSLQFEMSGIDKLIDIGWHLVLPVISVSFYQLALIARITRTSIIDTLEQDYIVAAKSRGLPNNRVIISHALPNALLPLITVIGYNLGMVLAGSTVVEIVFGWPGIGKLAFDSVMNRDYTLLMGIFTFLSIVIVIANLLTDLIYRIFDPRVEYK